MRQQEEGRFFEEAYEQVVDLGNQLVESEEEVDGWEVASGILAGAVQFWLYAHQPCGEDDCEACVEIDTARKRMELLLDEVREHAEASDYFHTPNDIDVGRA